MVVWIATTQRHIRWHVIQSRTCFSETAVHQLYYKVLSEGKEKQCGAQYVALLYSLFSYYFLHGTSLICRGRLLEQFT